MKASDKKTTSGESPFSTNRQLNVPQSKGFTVKKSDKQTTKFIDFYRPDSLWTVRLDLTVRKIINERQYVEGEWSLRVNISPKAHSLKVTHPPIKY